MEDALCGSEPGLQLIETLLWDGTALVRLDRHMARLAASAARLGWGCESAAAAAALRDAVPAAGPARMRLTLDAAGRLQATAGALAAAPPLWRIGIAPERLRAEDPWLRIKSSRRARYDAARAALPAGVDEVIFLNRQAQVCEGTITNLFFDLGTGLMTPPARCGLLPGVLRQELLASGQCREAVLTAAELPGARLWAGNSLRGLIPAELAAG